MCRASLSVSRRFWYASIVDSQLIMTMFASGRDMLFRESRPILTPDIDKLLPKAVLIDTGNECRPVSRCDLLLWKRQHSEDE